MVLHTHPIKFIAEILGILLGSYFLWIRQWELALGSSMLLFLGSTLLVRKKEIDDLARTRLDKVMLVYVEPVGFAAYNLSVVPLVYGLWIHQILYIALAILILAAPHVWTRQ